MNKPEPIEEPDLTSLRKICQEYIDFIGSEHYHEDNDYDHYIFEQAMNTFFGDKWDYINNKL